MRSLIFEGKSWLTYELMGEKDKKRHKALLKTLKEMMRVDPASGLSKPGLLKYNLSGLWSKRTSQKDRLIYKFYDEYIYIFAIGGREDQNQKNIAPH
jgi:toxin YoeB